MKKYSKQIPTKHIVGESELKCPVCGGNLFRKRKVLLNTVWATFFNLDWANRRAMCYVCSKCTHILWFHSG